MARVSNRTWRKMVLWVIVGIVLVCTAMTIYAVSMILRPAVESKDAKSPETPAPLNNFLQEEPLELPEPEWLEEQEKESVQNRLTRVCR